jgi:hypothetical protein
MSKGSNIYIGVVAKDQATKQLQNMGRQIQGFAKATSTAFIGIGAAVVGAIGGLTRIVTSAATAADDLSTLASQTGLTVTQLQELAILAEQTGTSSNTLARGVLTLIGNLDRASDPASDVAQALNDLNIDIRDVNGELRPMGELFPEIINSLRDVENPTERARLASQLFGRALTTEMLPVLELTDEEYQAIIDRAYDLGRILSEDQVDALNDASMAWKEMKGMMEATKNQVATALLPVFERMNTIFLEKGVPALEKLVENIEKLIGWYTDLSDKTKDLIDKAVLFFASLLPVGLGLKAVMAASGPLIVILKGLAAIIAAVIAALGWWALAIAAVIAAGVYLWKNWDEVKAKAIEIWGAIPAWIEAKLMFIARLFGNLAGLAVNWGRDLINGFFNGIKNTWNNLKDQVTGFFTGIGDTVKGIFKIGSPSKLFMGYGRDVGLGFELGLEKSFGKIDMPSMMPALSAPGGNSNSYSLNANIYPGANGMSEHDFISSLDKYWRRVSRERGF